MKAIVQWDDKFNTGNFVIDYQHKRLVRMINELNEIRLHDELRPFLLNLVFDEVREYTEYHFKTEEDLMTSRNYSLFSEHKKIHSDFIEKLYSFKEQIEMQNKEVDLKLCDFLISWLFGHIANEDPKFISELTSGNGMV